MELSYHQVSVNRLAGSTPDPGIVLLEPPDRCASSSSRVSVTERSRHQPVERGHACFNMVNGALHRFWS